MTRVRHTVRDTIYYPLCPMGTLQVSSVPLVLGHSNPFNGFQYPGTFSLNLESGHDKRCHTLLRNCFQLYLIINFT